MEMKTSRAKTIQQRSIGFLVAFCQNALNENKNTKPFLYSKMTLYVNILNY